MTDSYYADKRRVAENEATLDLRKPIEQLLADVHDESLDSRQPDAQRLGRVIARFASLLAVLSKEAEKRAEKLEQQTSTLISLTRSLKVFTFVVVILTIGLLVEGGLQLFGFHQSPSKVTPNLQETNQTDNTSHNK